MNDTFIGQIKVEFAFYDYPNGVTGQVRMLLPSDVDYVSLFKTNSLHGYEGVLLAFMELEHCVRLRMVDEARRLEKK